MDVKKIMVYTRLVLVGSAVLIVLIFMGSNYEKTEVKFLHWRLWEGPRFYLMIAMASLGVVIFLVSKSIRKTIYIFLHLDYKLESFSTFSTEFVLRSNF